MRTLYNYWLMFSCLPLGILLLAVMGFSIYAVFAGLEMPYLLGATLVLFGTLFLLRWTGRWLTQYSRGNKALQEGDPGEAIREFEKGLGMKTWRRDDPRRGLLLLGLASAYVDAGEYEDAEPILEDCLACYHGAWGKDHAMTLGALMARGNLNLCQARFDEAEAIYQRILAIKRDRHGPDHPDVGVCLNNLGKLACDRMDFAAGEQYYRQALEVFRKKLKPTHTLVALAENNVAYVLAKQGRLEEAEPLAREAQAGIAKTLPNHYVHAAFWNTIGLIHFRRGELLEARENLLRGVRLLEEQYGEDHPQLIPHLTLLAEIHQAEDRLSDAEMLCQRALSIGKERLRPGHPDMVEAMEVYARILPAMGRSGEVEAWREQITSIKKGD